VLADAPENACEQAPVAMLFCTSGFAWRRSDLEDLADFYHTGHFRNDDGFRNAIARYMADEGTAFSRTIAGFHYLERKQFEAWHRFQTFVSGPAFGLLTPYNWPVKPAFM